MPSLEDPQGHLWTEIAAMLRSGQVTDLQFAAYRTLVLQGPSGPSALAKATGQSRGRIYQILRALVGHGLVRQLPGRPSRFTSVPLAEVLVDLAAASRHRTLLLEQASAAVAVKPLETGPPKEITTASDVHLVDGRRAWMAEVRRALLRARHTFSIGGPGLFGKRLAKSYPLLGEIRAAADRGVDVTIYASRGHGFDDDFRFLERQLAPASVRGIDANAPIPLVFVATDDAAIGTLTQPDDGRIDGGSDLGLMLRGPNAAAAARLLLRSMGSRFEQAALLEQPLRSLDGLIRGAEQIVSVVGNVWWGPGGDAAWLRSALAKARERGVEVRALMWSAPDEDSAMQDGVERVAFPLIDVVQVDEAMFTPGPTRGEHSTIRPIAGDVGPPDVWSQYIEAAWVQAHPRLSPSPPSASSLPGLSASRREL